MPESDPPEAITPPETPSRRVYSKSLAPLSGAVGQAMTARNFALVGVAVAIAASLPGMLDEVEEPLYRIGAALVAMVVIMIAARYLKNGR